MSSAHQGTSDVGSRTAADHFGLVGTTVVVTGAGRGQGAAEAEHLASLGAEVVAIDRDFPPAATPSTAITRRSFSVDDEEAWAELAAEFRAEGTRVRGLVNNAGITRRTRTTEVSAADMREVHDVNVVGPALAIRHLVDLMDPGASIVNVGSVAAFMGHYPVAYTSSKWAIRGLTAAAATELGPRGIRVNSVHPGFIETEMTASAAPEFREASIEAAPLGRVGSSPEVASVVAFLLSDLSSFVTGAEIPVDGGHAAQGGAKPVADALR